MKQLKQLRLLPAMMIVSFAASLAPANAAPGSLLSATAMQNAPAGAQGWRIRYETTDASGKPTVSTGILIAPTTPGNHRNVVAWAHPTVGVAEACAPSAKPGVFDTIPGLAAMLTQGWVVVASDYPGLGTPGPAAYLIGDATARAILDSVRAAVNYAPARAGRRFGVWGHSQGAHAALFVGQLAHGYAPELQIVGVAAAAPPTDLSANLGSSISPLVRAGLTAFAAASWSKVYHIDMKSIANPTGQRVIARLASQCTGDADLRTKIEVLRVNRQLNGVDLTKIDPWRELLIRNSAGRGRAGAPLLIAQSSGDQVVAPTVTRTFVSEACRRNERVEFLDAGAGPHATTAKVTATQTVHWLEERFAGRLAPSNCGG